MPHIAVLFEFPSLNGGEQSMLAVLNLLRQRSDFRFTAIVPPAGELARHVAGLEIPVWGLSVRNGDGIRHDAGDLRKDLHNALIQLTPDCLHSNSLSMSRLAAQLDLSDLSPCRRTGHLRDIIRLNRTVIADLNRNDALIAVSHATQDYHLTQGLRHDRCCVIYNGVDTDLFRPEHGTHARRQLFPQIPESARMLLSVGQICLRKGQLIVAQAVRQLLPTWQDLHLVIVGERHSGKAESIEYEQAIQREFAAAGMSDHLHMTGYRNDVADVMHAADILVHAAHQEPFGRTLLEAAASRLPIVATSVGGTTEMLRPDIDALLVEPNNAAALGHGIGQLLSKPQHALQLATSARCRITQEFPIQQAADQLARFWLDRI